jgi:uncharacterized membrane protein
LCSLVAGFLFAFAAVVMPGIRILGDREFILTFQVIDRVIQKNQPVFLLVWIGSVVMLISCVVLGVAELDGLGLTLLILATLIYLIGVQLPTVRFNVPLNNQLQTLDVDNMDEAARRSARGEFEPQWNRWNLIRTMLAGLVSGILLTLLLIL